MMPNCGPGCAVVNASRQLHVDDADTRQPLDGEDPTNGNRHEGRKIRADGIQREIDIDVRPVKDRRTGPFPGKEGCPTGGSSRISATRAAIRALNSSVSPGRAAKVPVDWSLAILAAMASAGPGVSIL